MWLDVIVEDVLASRPADRYVVNDAKSPSGPIHVGSLRGVVLHDCVARALQDCGRSAVPRERDTLVLSLDPVHDLGEPSLDRGER